MRKIFFAISLLLVVRAVSAQGYPFSSIPDSLKHRADAVVRTEQCLYEILKPGNAVVRNKKAITLLNEKANHYRYKAIYYDKFSHVNFVRGSVYDESGKVIKVIGMANALDMSAITGGSFYSDDRMKVLYFPLYKYPYTIEYEYEIEYSSLINYPTWEFQDSPGTAVEQSGIQFIVPKDMKLRYYGENLRNKTDSVYIDDNIIYTWQEENLPARISQNYIAKTYYTLPKICTAPLDFEYGGYQGSMSSWKTFGEWVYNLNRERDKLSGSDLTKVEELKSTSSGTRDLAKKIYEYMQSKTRYVSIQIGIGGFQTAEAASVSQNGFGDCKALSNYTLSLLKAAGIKAYYTLVMAGDEDQLNRNFVDNQFNHVILCVPLERDTVWLECTDQTLPFNYLGDFTSDRYVLLITPDGGKMTRTPGFTKNDNQLKRSGSMLINGTGTASGKIEAVYSGILYSKATSLFGLESEDEMKRYMYSVLRYSDFTVSTVNYREEKSEKPTATFSYSISINDFSVPSGQRIYFNPPVTKEVFMQDFPTALRITENTIESDSILYTLPGGYRVEYKPDNVSIESEFGSFRYNIETDNGKLIYKRYLEMNKGIIPVEKFPDFRNFINKIARTERERIILTRTI